MSIEMLGERVSALQKIEERLGVVASVLSDVADALASYPDGVRFTGAERPLTPLAVIRMDALIVKAKDWPSVDEIQRLLSEWHVEMHEARKAWRSLPPMDRDMVLDPGAERADPTRPCV